MVVLRDNFLFCVQGLIIPDGTQGTLYGARD